MSQTIELRADLAQFPAYHLVVVDQLVLAEGAAGGDSREGQLIAPLAAHGHTVFIDPAQAVHFPRFDELDGF